MNLWTPFSLAASSTALFDNASTTLLTVGSQWFTGLTSGELAVDANGKVYSATGKIAKGLDMSVVPQLTEQEARAVLFKNYVDEAKGEWNRAHEIAQDIETPSGSRVHAYLHRREGDESNAGYWYHRAGTRFSTLSLEMEWDEIVLSLLQS